MGTPTHEWSAVPIAEMVNDGQNPAWPSYHYPAGYTKAPSMFTSATSSDACCELCGHPIKIVYALQNDTKQWLLNVGSECVTHFNAGKSGKELASEKIKADKREALRKARVTMEATKSRIDALNLRDTEARSVSSQLWRIWEGMRRLLRGYHSDPADGWRNGQRVTIPASTDAEVSGWYRARKAHFETLAQRANNVAPR